MKQKDFFENFLPSGFGEMMFHFWYNNIKIGGILMSEQFGYCLRGPIDFSVTISVVTRKALFI
jgi:hypothetical protein